MDISLGRIFHELSRFVALSQENLYDKKILGIIELWYSGLYDSFMYSFIRKSVPDDISGKKRRLVFKTVVIIYICTSKIILIKIVQKYFLSTYFRIFIFVIK